MYRKRNVPPDAPQLPQFLDQELSNIEKAQQGPFPFLSLSMAFKEPARLSDGLIVLADGTSWDPGSGAGYYGFRAGAWRFLG